MANLALQFDLTARREKNLKVLQSVDDSVNEIIEDYSHVAVYEFETLSRTWERLDVEGSLFVTRSLTEPFYSLIVLNKKGTMFREIRQPADRVMITTECFLFFLQDRAISHSIYPRY
jgi:hypothetical protein